MLRASSACTPSSSKHVLSLPKHVLSLPKHVLSLAEACPELAEGVPAERLVPELHASTRQHARCPQMKHTKTIGCDSRFSPGAPVCMPR